MKTDNRVRIVNKSKDCITLDFKGEIGIQKSTWEEFNKIYEICQDDKRYCTIRPEWQKRLNEAEELICDAMVHYLQVDWKIASPDPKVVPDIVQMGTVGLYVKKISEILECSYLDAFKLLNLRAIQFRSSFGGGGFPGLGADKVLKKQNNQTKPNNNNSQISTNKILDFNPELAKLKEQLDKEEKGGN